MLDEKKTLEDCEVGEGSVIMMIRIQHNSNSGLDGAKEGSFSHKDLTSCWSSSASGSSRNDSYEAEEVPEEEEVKLSQSESDYVPSKQSQQYYEEEEEEALSYTPEEVKREDRDRVIVEKTMLKELFTTCNHPGCGVGVEKEDVKISYVGSAMRVTTFCLNSHTFTWESSSKVGEGTKQRYLSNILLGAYSLLCGLNFGQVTIYFLKILWDVFGTILSVKWNILLVNVCW